MCLTNWSLNKIQCLPIFVILLCLFFKRLFYSSYTEIFSFYPGTSELWVSKELSKLFIFLCDRMTFPDELTGNGAKGKKMEDRTGFRRMNVIRIWGQGWEDSAISINGTWLLQSQYTLSNGKTEKYEECRGKFNEIIWNGKSVGKTLSFSICIPTERIWEM